MRHGTQQKMKSLVDVLEFAQKSKEDVVDIVWGDEDIEVQELKCGDTIDEYVVTSIKKRDDGTMNIEAKKV